MLDLSRVRSRSVVGVAVLGLILFGAACAHDAPPPEAPLEAPPEETPPESASATPEPTAEPAPSSEATPATAEPSAETPSTSAPTRDSRGKEQIQQVMAANRDKVRACYDAALPQNPGIHGALVLDFVIDPRGDVKRAEVNWSASDLHIPELDTCAVDAVRSIKFPASSRGLESKVSYPFNFNPPRPELPPKKP
jgi:TonB family protein